MNLKTYEISSSNGNSNENLETSKSSTEIESTNSLIQQITDPNEEASFNLFYDVEDDSNVQLSKEEIKNFEINFNKFYVDSSKNSNGNFDNYLQSGLKLISLFPNPKYYKEQIQRIKEKITLPPLPKNKKQTLILDLDETLIHSDLDFNYENHKTILKFECEEEDGNEPGVSNKENEFLNPNVAPEKKKKPKKHVYGKEEDEELTSVHVADIQDDDFEKTLNLVATQSKIFIL